MIISGRFTVPKPAVVVHGSFYGLRGDIALVKTQARAISKRLKIQKPA